MYMFEKSLSPNSPSHIMEHFAGMGAGNQALLAELGVLHGFLLSWKADEMYKSNPTVGPRTKHETNEAVDESGDAASMPAHLDTLFVAASSDLFQAFPRGDTAQPWVQVAKNFYASSVGKKVLYADATFLQPFAPNELVFLPMPFVTSTDRVR